MNEIILFHLLDKTGANAGALCKVVNAKSSALARTSQKFTQRHLTSPF
jgi:hypothetical protein